MESNCLHIPNFAQSDMMLRRPITSGSRQAPDPFDQFLESRSMYRKHTARDASCLFRVIAEQMYDTQMLHYEVRLECVRFMTRKRRIFEQHVHCDFDTYMLDMAKPKTYGTMLELRALCCMYRRNVILFEPYNLGTAVTYNERFLDDFRVFYTNECHFDSVFTVDFIEMAAICQSICFKLLYKMMFKLPDVSFAVETMLHPQTFNWNDYEMEVDANGFILRIICCDGRSFQLDLPGETKCILDNYKLCLFHNNPMAQQTQLALESDDMDLSAPIELSKMSMTEANPRSFDLPIMNNLMPSVSSSDMLYLCPHPFNSCVRQLLDDGVTPFPYKVAKSLDPNMYRNIEFDSWNDMRKEAKRYNVYANDYNFKVGARCNVELLIDSNHRMYTCHIQKIGPDRSQCVVYVEKFGKKLMVPYDTLHPVPPDEFRPWTVPHRYQRQMQRVHLAKIVHKPKTQKWKKTKVFDMTNYFVASNCDVMHYLHLDMDTCYSFPPMLSQHHLDYQLQQKQMEFNNPIERADYYQQNNNRFQSSGNPARIRHLQEPQLPMITGGTISMQTPPASPHADQYVDYMPMSARSPLGPVSLPWIRSPLPMGEEFSAGFYSGPPIPANGCIMMHFDGFVPPTVQHLPMPHPPFVASPFMVGVQTPPPGAFMLSPLSGPPNCTINNLATHSDDYLVEAHRSINSNGENLPYDLGTLRYFYNIGVETHLRFFNGNNKNPSNTDQQQQLQFQQKLQKQCYETSAFEANSTPPTSPDAVAVTAVQSSTTSAADTSAFSAATSNEPAGDFNRGRGKRPEQLYDLNNDKQLSHVVMLPTPTPSPITKCNQFNFYPPAQAPIQPPQPMLLPPPPSRPPLFFSSHKCTQSPYSWGIPPHPPGLPLEMVNNHNMDSVANCQQPLQHSRPASFMS